MVEPDATPTPEAKVEKTPPPEAATPTTPAPEVKTSNEVKMVPESDLLAVKGVKEGLQAKLSEMETKYSDAHNKLLVAETKLTEVEGKYTEASAAVEELNTVKPQLVTAQQAVKDANEKVLEYRKKIIASTYNISEDTMSNKTIEQLDSYEEALKAVAGSRGTGNYALGGGGGGTSTAETPHQRALRLVEEAEAKRGIVKVKEEAKT